MSPRRINCKICDTLLSAEQIRFCSKKCRNLYDEPFSLKYRSSTPEIFISALIMNKPRANLARNREEVLKIYYQQKGLCSLSKVPMTYIRGAGIVPTNISIDKIDATKGYTLDNIQFVCYIVNSMKNVLTKEQLLFWCNQIIKNN